MSEWTGPEIVDCIAYFRIIPITNKEYCLRT